MKGKFASLFVGVTVLALLAGACVAPVAPPETSEPITIEITRIVEGTSVVEVVQQVVTATPVPRGGDTLTFRLGEDPETLFNLETTSLTADTVISTYLLDRLVYFDADGNPRGNLAESWEVSDDQREVTFHLRTGVKFHDGTDFNAEAVKFHFDYILDPANASPVSAFVGSLQEVHVVDDATVRLEFEEPFAAFFINMSYGYGGINSPTAVMAAGDQYGRNPVGTGPFMFEEWIPGSEIRLVRNPNYQQFRIDAVNQGPPLAERVILKVIPEDGTALAALETGEILSTNLGADTVTRFVGVTDYNVVIDREATNLVFLEFNHQKPPFDDPTFRRAIGHAINRDSAVLGAWGGYASPAYSLLAVGIPGHDPEVAAQSGTPYDPDRAGELFAEAGWTDTDGDGLLDKDGQPARFVVKSYAGFAHIIRTLEVIQANLREVGIEVTTELSDYGAFYPSLLEDNWDMDLMRWTWGDPVVLSDLFRSPGHRSKLPADPEIDDGLDRCDVTMDPELRNECVSEAQRLLLEKAIAVPILTNWTMFATRGEVRDFTIDFAGGLIPGDVWLEK